MDLSKNRFCKLFGVKYPLMNSPMPFIADADFVSAVSEAGALGVLAADYLSASELSEAIDQIRIKTDKPFAVNIRIPELRINREGQDDITDSLSPLRESLGCVADKERLPDIETLIDVVIRKGIGIVRVGFGGLREVYAERLEARGVKVIGAATSLLEAKVQRMAGADAIILQGIEAGGPRLNFEQPDTESQIGLMSLIGAATRATGLPTVASGGLMTEQQIRAAMLLGADAVEMGTYFLRSTESRAPQAFKDLLPYTKDSSTKLTRLFSGRLTRVIGNGLTEALEEANVKPVGYPAQLEAMLPVLRVAHRDNREDLLPLCAGQGAMLAKEGAVGTLIEQLFSD